MRVECLHLSADDKVEELITRARLWPKVIEVDESAFEAALLLAEISSIEAQDAG